MINSDNEIRTWVRGVLHDCLTFCSIRSSTRRWLWQLRCAGCVVPILQQSLLVAVAADGGRAGAAHRWAFAGVLGGGVADLTIHLPALALYLIVPSHFYGFSTLASRWIVALASLFVLATSFMGQAAGAWSRPRRSRR